LEGGNYWLNRGISWTKREFLIKMAMKVKMKIFT